MSDRDNVAINVKTPTPPHLSFAYICPVCGNDGGYATYNLLEAAEENGYIGHKVDGFDSMHDTWACEDCGAELTLTVTEAGDER